MIRVRPVAAGLILVAIAGCARWERREPHRLDAWIGGEERDLVLAAGAPNAVHTLQDGSRILTWRRSHTEQRHGEKTTVMEVRVMDGRTVLVPVTREQPGSDFRYECTASFEVDTQGIIRAHGLHGNDCDDFLN